MEKPHILENVTLAKRKTLWFQHDAVSDFLTSCVNYALDSHYKHEGQDKTDIFCGLQIQRISLQPTSASNAIDKS